MACVFIRVQEQIEDAGEANLETEIVLSRDISPWEAEHYFAVTKDIEGEDMASLTGDFITRVVEGPYRKTKDYSHDMEVAVTTIGKTAKRVFFFYTTRPKCAKNYGEIYMVGVAEV